MKSGIAITLIVIAGVFGFVSGYSIGLKNGSNQVAVSSAPAPAASATETKAATGGYGAPAAAEKPAAAAPAAKAATGGYGQ